jgi:hypothetical protein
MEASEVLGLNDNKDQAQSQTKLHHFSALLPELKHSKQLASESARIYDGKSHELLSEY